MKAQSAMEYLMTYGWAILIVIVVVCALYSMGVFTKPTITDNLQLCRSWCNNITTEQYTYREATVDSMRCNCLVSIPIENLS